MRAYAYGGMHALVAMRHGTTPSRYMPFPLARVLACLGLHIMLCATHKAANKQLYCPTYYMCNYVGVISARSVSCHVPVPVIHLTQAKQVFGGHETPLYFLPQ